MDSDASIEETDLVHDFHESDVEICESTGKETREEIRHDAIGVLPNEESLANEGSLVQRARETLKNIPSNLV